MAREPFPVFYAAGVTARGMVRILHAEISEAKSDLEEAIGQEGADDETVTIYGGATT